MVDIDDLRSVAHQRAPLDPVADAEARLPGRYDERRRLLWLLAETTLFMALGAIAFLVLAADGGYRMGAVVILGGAGLKRMHGLTCAVLEVRTQIAELERQRGR